MKFEANINHEFHGSTGIADTTETMIWPLAHPLSVHYDTPRLYFHGHNVDYYPEAREFVLKAGARLSFRNYMNCFPYAKWVKETGIESVSLKLRYHGGPGEFLLFAERHGQRELLKTEALPSLEAGGEVHIDVPHVGEGAVLLTSKILARKEITFIDMGYFTSAAPVRNASLAIVITTHDRPIDVAAAVRALVELQTLVPGIKIIVVNNGKKPLQFSHATNVRVIQNKNLGGAGGFTRGLCAILDEGSFSHALFMDDDALCHPMAVRRALTFLTYTKRNNAAIGGAMLYAEHPHLQYEQGAELSSYGVRSINQNYDLEHIQPVVENELAAPPAFGPWWFFLFPLQAMRTLPFPFFVRGDDVAFSLQNNFDILALPSAAAWQPSFEYKISASTEYLATRSFLMLPLVVEGKHWNCSETLEGFKKQFTLEVDAYRYPIAEAMLSALEDAMMGPSFWERESNTLARLGRLKALQAQTTQRARLDYPSPTDENKVGRLFGRLWYKLQRTLPVMAYLKFRKPGISYNMWPQPVEAAGRRGMVYASRDGKNRLACRFDARWMRSLRKRGAELMIRYETTFDANREIYDAARESLQGLEAWTKKFQ